MGVSVAAAFVIVFVVQCGPAFGLTVDPLEAEPLDSEEKTRVDELSTAEPIDYGGNTEDTGPQTFGPPVGDEDYGDDDTGNGNGFETGDGNEFETGNGNEFETANDNVDAFEPGNGNENDFEAGNGDGNSFDAGNGNGDEFETGDGSGNGDGAGDDYGPETDNNGEDAAFEESNDLKKASSVEVNTHSVNGTGSGNSSDVTGNRRGVESQGVVRNENAGNNGNKTTTTPDRSRIRGSSGTRSRSNLNKKGDKHGSNVVKNESLSGNRSSSANLSGGYVTNGNVNRTSVIRSKRRNGSEARGNGGKNVSKINGTISELSVGGNGSLTVTAGKALTNANTTSDGSSLNKGANILSMNETGSENTDRPKSTKTGNGSKVNGNEYWNGFKHYVTVKRTKTYVVPNEAESENKNVTKIGATGDRSHNTNGNENTGHASENSEVKASVVEVLGNLTQRSTEDTMNNTKECGKIDSSECAETPQNMTMTSEKPAETEVNRTQVARRRSFMKTSGSNTDEIEMDVQKGESSKRSYNYDETQVPPPGSEIITYDYGEIKEIIIPENPPRAPIPPPDTQRYGRQPDANPNPDPSHYGYHQKPYFYNTPQTVPDLKYTQTSPPQDPAPAYYYNPPETNSSPYPTRSNFQNHAPNQNFDPNFEGYSRNHDQNSPHDYNTYSSTPHPNQSFEIQSKHDARSEFKNHGPNLQFSRDNENYVSHPYTDSNSYTGPSDPETRTGFSENPSSYGSSGPGATMGPSRSPPEFSPSVPDARNPSSNLDPSVLDLNSAKSPYDNHQKSGPVYEFYGTPNAKTWISHESIPIKNPSTDSGPPIVEIIYHRENGVVYEDDILDDFTTSSPVSYTSGNFPPTGDFPASDFPSAPERPLPVDFPTSSFPPGYKRPQNPRPSGVFPNSGNFPASDDDRFKSNHGRRGKQKGEGKSTRRPTKNRGFLEKTTSTPPRRRPGSSSRPKTKATSFDSSIKKPAQDHFSHSDVDFDDEDFPDGDFPDVPKTKTSNVKNSNPSQKHKSDKEPRKKEKAPKSQEHKQSGFDDFSNIKDVDEDEDDDGIPKRPKLTDFDVARDIIPKKPKAPKFEDGDDDNFNTKSKDSNTGTEDGDFADKVKHTKFEIGDDDFSKTSKTSNFDTDDIDFANLEDTDFRDLKEQTDDGPPVKGQIADFPDEWQKTKNINSGTKKQKSEKPKHEKHKSEKGEKHDSGQKISEGKQGEKGSKTQKEHSEGEKGHAEEGKESAGSAKKRGKKKKEDDEGGYYAEKHKGEEGEKKGDFHDAEKHHKGHSTKGKHEIHKKDEFSRKHSFYDEHHEGGKHEKHGGYEKKKKVEKGEESHKGGSEEGYEEEHDGKEGKFKKGKRYKGDKGGEDTEGKDVKFSHEEEYGKKGGEEKKLEKEFEL